MSFADTIRQEVIAAGKATQERIDITAEKIADAFLNKIKNPDFARPGVLSPDRRSFSCIECCDGMNEAEMQAVANRLAEPTYGFKVESMFNYHNGNRIIISV